MTQWHLWVFRVSILHQFLFWFLDEHFHPLPHLLWCTVSPTFIPASQCFVSAQVHITGYHGRYLIGTLDNLIWSPLITLIWQVIWPITCSSLRKQDPGAQILFRIAVVFVLRYAGFQLWEAQPQAQTFLLAPAEPSWLAPTEELAWEPLSHSMGTVSFQRNCYSSNVFS